MALMSSGLMDVVAIRRLGEALSNSVGETGKCKGNDLLSASRRPVAKLGVEMGSTLDSRCQFQWKQ